MGVSYYIHNILPPNGKANATTAFGDEVIQRQLRAQQRQLKYYKDKKAQEYAKTVGEAQDFTTLLEDLKNILENKVAKTLVQQLPTISFGGMRQGLLAAQGKIAGISVEQGSAMLESAIAKMDSDLQQYEQIYGVCSGLVNKHGATWMSQKDLNRIQNYSKRINEARIKIQSLKKNPENAWGILQGAATAAQTVGGFVSEAAMTNLLNMLNIQTSSGLTVKTVQSGASGGKKGNKGFKVRTEDIGISVQDQSGTVTVSLPGISLKRTSSGQTHGANNPQYRIHIKSSSIGNLIANAGLRSNSAFNLNSFYNYYANHGRTTHRMGDNNAKVINTVTGITQLYKAFHASMLLTAIAGGIKADELAYYLVVNDQVYTTEEILEMALEKNGGMASISAGVTPKLNLDQILKGQGTSLSKGQKAIAAHHSNLFAKYKDPDIPDSIESQRRSSEILSAINGITLHLNLNIALNKVV